MPYSTFPIVRFGFALLLGLCLLAPSIQAQQKQEQAPAEQEDEVIRINTQLVQTDIMVFDKQGHFVDNLKGDQFELRVDGKPVQVSFFDKIVAGGSSEEAQLAAARGVASANDSSKPIPLDRGRTIFFFLDDMHLASDSMVRARKALLNFIDKEMGQNDQVGIASASGQIGFLQQLTNNKAVLRAAVARLNFRPYDVRDMDRPPMSVYQGFEINERSNQELLNYFVEQLQSEIPMLTRDRAEQLVKERADAMLQQAAAVTTNSLASLESLARSSAPLPGRKIIFFLSDGFVITNRVSNIPEKLRRITDAAARTGVVIYTMEARGLMTGMPDASVEMRGDPSGRVATAAIGEISTEQEPLRTLAADTGGRALLNTNSLGAGIKNTLQETSVYYLLAWRPEADVKGGGKFRKIEASIKGRPELTVRVRRGYYDVAPGPIATRKPAGAAPGAVKTPEEELRKTLGAVYPKTELPTMLAVNYMDMPNVGPVVTTTMQVMGNTPPSESVDGKPAQAMIYVAGVLFNDQGKAIASFQNRLGITRNTTNPPASTTAIPPPIFYTYQFHAPPGLYQVRVAAREEKSGRTGSATEWIEIPDFTSGSLAMSSLLIGERKQAAQEETKTVSGAISDISVDHRFTKTSHLRFLTYVYNAGRVPAGNGVPNVTLQIQVLRDDRPVITTPLRKVATEGIADMARLPYAAEISLAALPVGQYILKVTAIDLINKKSTTQRASFEIE